MAFKSIRIAFLLGLCITAVDTSAIAEELTYATIKAAHYNDFWKSQFSSDVLIRYDDVKDRLAFYSDETLTTFVFYLARTEIDSLARRIEKYQKWNRQASERGVAIQKEIGPVWADFSAWKMGDEWSIGTSFRFVAHFFSQSPQVHQLVLVFPKLVAKSNEYDTHSADDLYFGWDGAQELGRLLDPAAIDAWLVEQKQKKAVEDEFK